MSGNIHTLFLDTPNGDGYPSWAPALLVCLFMLAFWNLWWRPRLESKRPMNSLPMPPKSHWLFGHMAYFQGVCFLKSFQRAMFDYADENGHTAFWIGPLKFFSPTHWEDVRTILHSVYERENLPFLGKHVRMFIGPKQIGFLKGKEWRYHRGALVRSLKPENMRQSKSSMIKVAAGLVTSLKNKIAQQQGQSIRENVHDLVKMVTIDGFGKAAFMTDFGCCTSLSLTPFSKAFNLLMQEFILRLEAPVYVPWNFFYSIPTRRNREMLASRQLVRSFLDDMIKLRREKPAGDILSNLIAAHNESAETERPDGGCSDETLKDVMMSMLLAGYDTTSTAVSYALYLIGTHPEVEANCLEEIRNSPPADTDVDDYCYCQAVFQETLRLYSPAPQILRTLQKPLKLESGLVLPSGMFITMPIFHIQRSERTFKDALTFRPDRWVKRDPATGRWTERQMADVDTSSIPPGNRDACFDFSAGARSCPGKRFAFQLGTITLVSLMQDLKFTVEPGYEIVPSRCGPLQAPKGGVHLTISVRDEQS